MPRNQFPLPLCVSIKLFLWWRTRHFSVLYSTCFWSPTIANQCASFAEPGWNNRVDCICNYGSTGKYNSLCLNTAEELGLLTKVYYLFVGLESFPLSAQLCFLWFLVSLGRSLCRCLSWDTTVLSLTGFRARLVTSYFATFCHHGCCILV